MRFEDLHPFFQGIGQEKVCDVFGKTVDFIQKLQDEALDQDLLHSMQDAPDAVRNRIIAELFGFPIGPHSEKGCCGATASPESKKGKATEKKKSSNDKLYPNEDSKKAHDELLKEQSGSSKETLEDVRARVFGRKRTAASAEETAEKTSGSNKEEETAEKTSGSNKEEKTAEVPPAKIDEERLKPEEEKKHNDTPTSPTQADSKIGESPVNDSVYEWKFPVDEWCDPKDAEVTVTDSIIRLNLCKKEINPETKVSTLKTLDFSVNLPEDAVIEKVSASYNEENSEFVLRAPKRQPPAKTTGRSLRINFKA